MRDLVVTLDRGRGLARFLTSVGEAPPPIPAPPSLRGTGIGAVPGADHLEVLFVVPGSGGEAAGIRPGDRIVAVDGLPVGTWGCEHPRDQDAEWSEQTIVRGQETSVVRVAVVVLVE